MNTKDHRVLYFHFHFWRIIGKCCHVKLATSTVNAWIRGGKPIVIKGDPNTLSDANHTLSLYSFHKSWKGPSLSFHEEFLVCQRISLKNLSKLKPGKHLLRTPMRIRNQNLHQTVSTYVIKTVQTEWITVQQWTKTKQKKTGKAKRILLHNQTMKFPLLRANIAVKQYAAPLLLPCHMPDALNATHIGKSQLFRFKKKKKENK